MGSMSIMHWLIVVAVVLLLFARGKIPELMGDVANGIKSFKNGMRDDESAGPALADGEQPQVDEPHLPSPSPGQPAHRSDSRP